MPGISLITALPNFVTLEQHQELTSLTPSSFAELPAILYHEERNVSITLDPPLDGISPEDCASGTVYILSRSVQRIFGVKQTDGGFQPVDFPVHHWERTTSHLSNYLSACYIQGRLRTFHILPVRRIN